MSDVAYAEFNDYAQRENADLADQNTIEAQLLAMSRYIDRKLRCAPGLFAPADGQTFYFDGSGSHLLPLRDDEGAYYPLRSVDADAIRPDYDRTGDYDQALSWDLDDVFIWPIPRNHEGIGRPIKSLELRRIGRAPYTIWPYADGSVRITGDWGWATNPARNCRAGRQADPRRGRLAARRRHRLDRPARGGRPADGRHLAALALDREPVPLRRQGGLLT